MKMDEKKLYCQSCERLEDHRQEDENEVSIVWECQACESITFTHK